MPDCTVTDEFASFTLMTAFMWRVMSSEMPPLGVSTPRVTDECPPNGVMGIFFVLQNFTRAITSSSFRGYTTASGGVSTLPSRSLRRSR